MASPTSYKINVSVATGYMKLVIVSSTTLVMDRLAKSRDQKPTASPKQRDVRLRHLRLVRDLIGVSSNIRGARMYGFWIRCSTISLPRTKDFRGLNRTSVDNMGNMTILVSRNTQSSQKSLTKMKDIFGMAITWNNCKRQRKNNNILRTHRYSILKSIIRTVSVDKKRTP